MKTTQPHLAGILPACAALATALALALPVTAAAADDNTGLYLSGDIGPNFVPNPTVHPGGGTLAMDPGLRFGGALGYNLNRWVGVEGETGFLYNSAAHDPHDSWLGQIPLMGNVVFRYESSTPWTPYAGVGLGGVLGIMNNNFGTDTSGVFAWQIMLGVRYQLKDRLAVDAGYKYLGTADQHYNLGGPLALSDVHNHMFAISLTWKF